jgi:hypothetical protein
MAVEAGHIVVSFPAEIIRSALAKTSGVLGFWRRISAGWRERKPRWIGSTRLAMPLAEFCDWQSANTLS